MRCSIAPAPSSGVDFAGGQVQFRRRLANRPAGDRVQKITLPLARLIHHRRAGARHLQVAGRRGRGHQLPRKKFIAPRVVARVEVHADCRALVRQCLNALHRHLSVRDAPSPVVPFRLCCRRAGGEGCEFRLTWRGGGHRVMLHHQRCSPQAEPLCSFNRGYCVVLAHCHHHRNPARRRRHRHCPRRPSRHPARCCRHRHSRD
jgi:hypothetical protein